jgi:hypothetical protein
MNNHPILLLHVSSGTVGLLSGAVALSFRKGSRPHKIAGAVFFISMLTASAAGAFLALKNSEMDNVFGGVLTFYLVATAWVTAKRKDGETGLFDWIGFLVAAAIAAAAVTYWVEAAFSQTGTKAGIPAGSYFLPAVVALIAATGDARILLRGGLAVCSESRGISGACASDCSSLLRPFFWPAHSYFPLCSPEHIYS